MKCGQEIHVKDFYGANAVRFRAQCDGLWLVIAYNPSHLNGFVMPDWRAVLRELVALAVPAKLTERTMRASAIGTGTYVDVPLSYPLSISGLARLLDAPADEVGAQLADLAVSVD